MLSTLKQRWYALHPQLGRKNLDDCWQEIESSYSEAHRHYHNLQHLEMLFRWYDVYESELDVPAVVAYAIFYHDIIYTPGRGDNEERSASVAARALERLNVSNDRIEDVQLYIRTTKEHHTYTGNDHDLQYLLDFDLSILAAERDQYKKYLHDVRKEFAHVPDVQFRWGRTAYVQNWLRLPHLFFTGAFRSKEQVARENLQWEIEEGLRHI